MAVSKFNGIVRSLVATASRRGVFGLSLAALATAEMPFESEAKKRKKKKNKRCKGGTVRCKKLCANLKSDHNHCGSCSNRCQGELDCVNGTCQCQGAICQLLAFENVDGVGLDLVVDANGNVFAVTNANKLSVYSPAGALIRTIGEYGTEPGEFDDPASVAIAPDGTLFVADTGNGRIQKIAPNGATDVWELPGQPEGVAVTTSGIVYTTIDISESQIHRLDSTGAIVYSWGPDGTDATGFNYLGDIAVDSSGAIFVVDTYADLVYRFTDGGAGNVVQDWVQGDSGVDPGEFDYPTGIAVSGGRVFVLDELNERIQALSASDGSFLFQWQLGEPDSDPRVYGVGVGPNGRVYVAGISEIGVYEVGGG